MDTINIYEAKTQFSRLVDRVVSGEEVVIGRHGKPLVRMIKFETKPTTVRFGVLKGPFTMADDFDAPLPDDVLAAFEGR